MPKKRTSTEELIEQLEAELDVPELDFEQDTYVDDGYEDDGQPDSYTEYQDLYEGDDSFGEHY